MNDLISLPTCLSNELFYNSCTQTTPKQVCISLLMYHIFIYLFLYFCYKPPNTKAFFELKRTCFILLGLMDHSFPSFIGPKKAV